MQTTDNQSTAGQNDASGPPSLVVEGSRKSEPRANGCELIEAERRRQIEAEGWTEEHDDSHQGGQLALAACAYAMPHGKAVSFRGGSEADIDFSLFVWPRWLWPFEKESFKRNMLSHNAKDERIRDLVKAGALVAAEIDRLQRAAQAA